MTVAKHILLKCQKGDQIALGELYNIYNRKVMGLCLRYSKNRADAEDIFQDAFIKIFQEIPKVKNLESFDFWLNRTVINTALNHYHKTKRHKNNDLLFEDDKANDDFNLMLDALDEQTILKLIQELPDGYRMIFNMYAIDGYSHPEIAKIIGCSEGNSKSQLSRAKSILKKQLKELGIEKYVKYA